MNESEIVSGQRSAWCLLKKLGEGDAGEVFLVESLMSAQTAILKRTPRSVFSGDIFRQAAQIRTEAKILKTLSDVFSKDAKSGINVPALLDQSKPGSEFNERPFIVTEKAAGFDLGFLTRLTQLGLSAEDDLGKLGPQEQAFIDSICKSRKIPNRILITILYRLTSLLEQIHTIHASVDGRETWGIVWNDVKPNHLFWNPKDSLLTVIDWGNARFLEADQMTNDRQFSWTDDYRQLFEEMSRTLSVVAPELPARLGWPSQFSVEDTTPLGIEALKSRLDFALQKEMHGLIEARTDETNLLKAETASDNPLADIEIIQKRLLEYGEIPDYPGMMGYALSLAARWTMEDRMDDLRGLCEWAKRLPGADDDQWSLVDFLAQISGRSNGNQRKAFLEAVQAAICKDWESLLWNMLAAIQDFPEPAWWQALSSMVRNLALGSEGETLRPLVAINRLNFALEAAIRRMEDLPSQSRGGPNSSSETLERALSLARLIKEEIIANWTQLDPGPPDFGLEYTRPEVLLAEAGDLLPEEQRFTLAILNYPKTQVRQVMEAWGNKDFLEAGKGLRRLLLWDPDRRRVLHASRAIQVAPDYLKKVHIGPQSGESVPEWITRVEFQGRELRNQVGPANWLDAILESCQQIRKGVWPSDLFQENPGILQEMPWLKKFERIEKVPDLAVKAPALETNHPVGAPPVMRGVEEGKLGPEGTLSLIEPLDAWMPEARGSSARVVSGVLRFPEDQSRQAAIKLMRMDKVNYSLPLFCEEVRVLSRMQEVAGVSHLLECGFIQLDEDAQFPLESASQAALAVGRVMRIGLASCEEFLNRIQAKIEEGWTPYVAVELQKQADSLLLLCDAGMRRGQFMPTVTLLQMSIQICDILQAAHQHNIVYRDHKILHYYWQAENNGIYVIDWNVARYHPDGLTETDIHMDLVQFGARGLHHILTGRTAPGALPLGPTRPEEIEQAALSYKTQWTYDDQRLSAGLRSILERVLAGEYSSAAVLGDDLKKTMMQIPDAHL
jgi:serine/threonine protein kinase